MNTLGIFVLVTSAAFGKGLPRIYNGPYKSAQQQGLPGIPIPTLPPNVGNPQGGLPGFGSSRPQFPSFSIPSGMPGTMPPLPFSTDNWGNINRRPATPQWPSYQTFQNNNGQQGGQESRLPWSPASGNNGNGARWPGMRSPPPSFPFNMTQVRLNRQDRFSWPPTPYSSRNSDRNRNGMFGLGDPPSSRYGQDTDNERPNIFRSPPPFFRRTDRSSRTSIRTPPSFQLGNGDGDY